MRFSVRIKYFSFKYKIDSSGNVGIGSALITPNTNFDNLVISQNGNSGITILSNNANDGGIYFGDNDSNNRGQLKYLHGSNSMTFTTDDIERMRIDSSGLVSLTESLQIANTSPAFTSGSGLAIHNDSIPRLKLSNSTSGQGATDGFELLLGGVDAYVYNYEGGSLILGTSATERMRITSAGNVGIGTTTPIQKLEVKGFSNSPDSGQIIISETDNPNRRLSLGVNNSANLGYIQSLVAGDDYYSLALNPQGGNVGIGTTTPIMKFYILIVISNLHQGKLLFPQTAQQEECFGF